MNDYSFYLVPMSRIIINRKNEWNNRLRSVHIYIDGQKAGSIANGESKAFDIEPGLHQVRAGIDWCSSKELPFTIGEDEKKYFTLSNFKYSNMIAFATIAIVVLHFIARRLGGVHWVIWFAIPGFLVLMYYISFGRKKYLEICETADWMK